jgi:hypothetical protein
VTRGDGVSARDVSDALDLLRASAGASQAS